MPSRILIMLSLVLGLSACESRFNPMNWFSGSSEETIALIPEGGFGDSVDNRSIVRQITEMQVLRTPGGAIVRVTGLPPTQGYWDAELVAENDELPINGVLSYVFRVHAPAGPAAGNSTAARQVIVAHFISDVTLAGVRQIRVTAVENSRTARR